MEEQALQPKSYRVLAPAGLDWHGKHAEPGEIRSDLYIGSINWLLSCGLIEHLEDDAPPAEAEGERASDG